MNKVLAGIGVVAGLAASVGIWYALERVDRSELPEWMGGEATEKPSESQGKVWDKFVAVDDLSKQDFTAWPGQLECDPWHRWEGFSRDKELLVSEGMVAYDNGEVQAFLDSTQGGTVVPAQLSARFEWWRGEVSGTTVVMEGWYTAGNDDLKRLSMTGTLAEGELYLEGERGPRTCRITASRPD
ncbi:hypothetical protein [Marinimicrobium agarilyticum]|uniref:hypothetical protein n=1 Tax=Marinimicrobium agarilyticum TaxID=306546 RepID=UPI00041FFC3D|nr:hypothetical protein [Marinimicrobium agarilyticum]